MPVLPAYPERPAITWRANGELVGLIVDDAIVLRDWLVKENAWRQAVSETWELFLIETRKD